MALISCPECGQKVSDQAKVCIHCGYPLGPRNFTVKVKTPKDEQVIVKIPWVFTDLNTGKVLARVSQNQVAVFEVDKPTRIECRIENRGFIPAVLDYVPHENARYMITYVRPFWGKPSLSFQEVDRIDSD